MTERTGWKSPSTKGVATMANLVSRELHTQTIEKRHGNMRKSTMPPSRPHTQDTCGGKDRVETSKAKQLRKKSSWTVETRQNN